MDARDGRLLRDGTDPTIVFERHLAAPPAAVWAALTDPERIRSWFVRTELEPRVGGRIVEHHDHAGLSMAGVVTRFEPPRAFGHNWWADASATREMGSILWELTPDGDTGTRLRVTNVVSHGGDPIGPLAGWHISLDVLADVLAGADGTDHRPPAGHFDAGGWTETQSGTGHWRRRAELEAGYRADLG